MPRPTEAIIDLDSLAKNYKAAKDLLSEQTEIFPVVKANAYGHGSIETVKKLKQSGAEKFCVALVDEALELIDSGVEADYIILGGIFPGEEELAVRHDLRPVIFRAKDAEVLDKEAGRQDKQIKVHIKLDTGMGRIGVDPMEIFQFIEDVAGRKNIKIEGLLSHLSVSSSDDEDDIRYTRDQLSSFLLIKKGLEKKSYQIPCFHMANSGGLLRYPESRHNAVRPGILLYGSSPSADVKIPEEIKGVMSIRSKTCFLKKVPEGTSISYNRETKVERESLIATVPIGYEDGLPRRLPAGFEFIVNGARAPLAGVVTMDMIMLDVTDVKGVSEGDEVIIIGGQGKESVSVEDISKASGTITYEILTNIGSRVPRIYTGK
jgi:alanine racemase